MDDTKHSLSDDDILTTPLGAAEQRAASIDPDADEDVAGEDADADDSDETLEADDDSDDSDDDGGDSDGQDVA